MNDIQQIFFELIRVAISTQNDMSRLPSSKEWEALYGMATKQGLIGICFAGVQKILSNNSLNGEDCSMIGMNEMLYLTWMGMAAQIQHNYDRHKRFIGKLAKFYEQESVGMMLLKGYGLSLYYPTPQLRNPGDVDIFLFNLDNAKVKAWKRGDDAIKERMKIEVISDCEHHTKFVLDGISVENHYDFVNTRIRHSSKLLERKLKSLAEDHSNKINIDGNTVCLPSDELNALFLLRHCAGHFASEGITLRNVIDWGLFVCNANELDWENLWHIAKEYNMHKFMMCMNMICVNDLGLNADKFDIRYEDKVLKKRVLSEVIQGTDMVIGASVWQRTKRWWQHRWKHKICYSDSMLSSFVYSVKANLSKASAE